MPISSFPFTSFRFERGFECGDAFALCNEAGFLCRHRLKCCKAFLVDSRLGRSDYGTLRCWLFLNFSIYKVDLVDTVVYGVFDCRFTSSC